MEGHEAATTDLIAYEVLTGLAEIVRIAPEWDSLLDRTNCNRAFSSSYWYVCACRNDPSVEPHLITARRGGILAGVLPLALTNEGRTAIFPSHISDYNDIVACGEDVAVQIGLLEYLTASVNGSCTIVLARLRSDSNCIRALSAMTSAGIIEQSAREDMACYCVKLSTDYDEYLGTRSKIFRRKLKLAQHKADRLNLAIRELEPEWFCPSRLPDTFLSLHLPRIGQESYFHQPAAQAFIGDLLPVLFAERRMRAFALFEGERMLAVDLLMVGINSLCAWNGGFLPEAARLSPGKLLLAAEIKQAFAIGLEEYDFLRGSHEYKASWANDCRYVRRLELGAGH